MWNSLRFPWNVSLLQVLFLLYRWLFTDKQVDNGGFDRMQTSSFLTHLWNKFFKSSYSRPLPAIFSVMLLSSRRPKSVVAVVNYRYFISFAASFSEINELLLMIISSERASLEENKILWRTETSSASWQSLANLPVEFVSVSNNMRL